MRNFLYKRFNISFSRAGDDIQLYKLINNREPGVYVDIGSWHPLKASNTYFFYLRNWKGICIDPNPELKKLYEKQRPNDIFLNSGIGEQKGTSTYFMLNDHFSSMNTFDYDFLKEEGVESEIKKRIEVPVNSLKEVLNHHIDSKDRIDFFDIDVEGRDLDVLKSNDWTKYRPKIIMVESNINIHDDLTSGIANFLKSKDYRIIGKSIISGNLGNLFFIEQPY